MPDNRVVGVVREDVGMSCMLQVAPRGDHVRKGESQRHRRSASVCRSAFPSNPSGLRNVAAF